MTKTKIDLTERNCASLAKIAQESKKNFEKDSRMLGYI